MSHYDIVKTNLKIADRSRGGPTVKKNLGVVLLAAGKSTRFSGLDKKPFALLDGRAVWLRSAEIFSTRHDVCQILLVVPPEDEAEFRRRFAANLAFMEITPCVGGAERYDSVANALAALKPDAEFVAVHDTARPCVHPDQVDAVVSTGKATGAAILAVPIADTIKQADVQRHVTATIPRGGLWLAQTPQVFRTEWLREAHARRAEKKLKATDDAELVESCGRRVTIVDGAPTNIKITTNADLDLAAAILKARPAPKKKSIHPFADEAQW
jgi:2-C-methyl-D-erythritol 4-phosphate cytidylyltransferase